MKDCLKFCFVWLSVFVLCAEARLPAENIALGKPYVLSSPCNYKECADAYDGKQLTDGKHVPDPNRQMWVQKEAVGWQKFGNFEESVTVDLGTCENLGGFAYSTAAGPAAGVLWPRKVMVYVSEDKKTWTRAGDLWDKSVKMDGGPSVTATTYRACSAGMPCRGRYVTFVHVGSRFGFCDEVEIFRGESDNSITMPLPSLRVFNTISGALLEEHVNTAVAADARLVGIEAPHIVFPPDVDRRQFNVSLPLGPIHEKVWSANAPRLRRAGILDPVYWTNDRWANLSPVAIPTQEQLEHKPLVVEMMRGETRSTAINLVNPFDVPLTAEVTVEGLPQDVHVQCHEVLYMLGERNIESKAIGPDGIAPGGYGPVASALKPGEGTRICLSLLPGISRQVWISFVRPVGRSGTFDGCVRTKIGERNLVYPIRLVLFDLDFPAHPRLHLAGCDNNISCFGRPAAFVGDKRLELDLYVDTVWGDRVFPKNARFDNKGKLENETELDFSVLDSWVAKWPEARRFVSFKSVLAGQGFMGEHYGTQRFERMVGDYFRAWYDHFRMIAGDRDILLLILDEPNSPKKLETHLAWAKAIRAAVPDLRLFVDPNYCPTDRLPQELIDSVDVVCPHHPDVWKEDRYLELANRVRVKGRKELEFYSCFVGARHLDPVRYYRASFWGAFKVGATGITFWAFGDAGSSEGSLNVFAHRHLDCSPFLALPDGAMPTKQSEGIREGIQDHELLSMLADRAKAIQGKGGDATQIERFLEEVVQLMPEPWAGHCWTTECARDKYDSFRLRALHLLNKLRNKMEVKDI